MGNINSRDHRRDNSENRATRRPDRRIRFPSVSEAFRALPPKWRSRIGGMLIALLLEWIARRRAISGAMGFTVVP